MSTFSYQPETLRAPTQLDSSLLRTRKESFVASVETGFDSMVGSYANPVKHWYLGTLDKESGLGKITKEDVDKLNEQGVPLEYSRVKDFTPSQLKQAAFETVEDTLRTTRINQQYAGTNMLGSFLPYVIDPVNLVPFGRIAAVGKAGVAFNKLNLAINRGQRFRAGAQSYKQYAKEAFLGNAAVEPLYYMDARTSGQEYDAVDMSFNVLLGTGIGTGFFGTIGAGINFRKAGRNLQNIQDFESMYSFLETGDYDQAVNVAFRDIPKFRESIQKIDILADAVKQAYDTDGIFRFDQLDAQQQKAVRKVLQNFVDNGVQSSLARTLSDQMIEEVRDNPNISVSDLSVTYRERYLKIYDALLGDGDTTGFNADDLDAYNKVTNKSGVFETKVDEAETKPLKIVNELNPKEFGNLKAAQEDANIIMAILRKHGVETLEDALAEGRISNRERIKLLKRFEKSYKKAYSKQIELASNVINNIFGAKVDIKRAPKDYKGIAFVRMEESPTIYITRAERLLGLGHHPFSVLLHEAGHSLKAIDPDAWQQLYKIVEDNPELKAGLEDFIENVRNYKRDGVAGEIPSVLLEWAITQKEFWRELQGRNRPLFVKLKEALKEMFALMTQRFQGDKADAVFNDRTLRSMLNKGTTPESLARSIAEVINLSRENRLGYGKTMDAIDTVRANIRRAAYSEDPAGTTNTERLLQENTPRDIEGDNRSLFELRYDTLAKSFEEMTGQSIIPLYDVLLQPLDEFAADIDPDAGEFISLSEFKARVQKYTAKILDEEFNRDDILLDSDYEQLYDNLRNFHTNNYNKSAIAMRNNELFRSIERAIDGKPQSQHADIRREVIKTYHEDAAGVIISNAIKRKSLQRQLDELKTKEEKVALLRSMLDGQERKGTPLMSGLENNMHAAGAEMVIPLLDVIYRHGMQELFMIDEGFSFLRDKGPRRFEMFGKNKKQRSIEFHRRLHQALLDRKLPKDMETIEAFEELFDVIQATELKLLKKLNEAGLDVKKLQDFGGVSQKWNAELIYDMGLPAFKKRMLEVLDLEATAKAHGDVLWVEGKSEPFDINKFIDQWYESLDPTRRIEDDVQVFNLENTFAGRMVRVKPEFATDVMMEFSGYDNVGYLMIQQFQRYAALAEMTRFAGTKPNEMLTGILNDIGARGVGNKSAKATIDAMTGILWNPVDTTLAGFSNVITKLSNILFMTGAGAASLSDVPLSASTIQVQGIDFVENNRVFLKAWKEATARRFGNDQKRMKDYWTGVGAGLDVLNNAVIRRVANTELGSGMLDKGVQFVMRYNGLEPLTNIHQEMYLDVITRGMAMELSSASPAIDLMNNLRAFGFTDAEIKRLGNAIDTDPNGVERIVPNSIGASKLREKYRQYLTKYMRQAVFMPDQGTRAQHMLGFRRGTKAGEMAYVSTQYMPFMSGMGKLLFRRFVSGNYGTGRADMIHRMSHLVAYLGGAMAFGYLTTVVKDILRGREPIGIDGLSAFDVSRIVQQSGVLGPLEVPLDVKDWGVLSALAPMPSTILGIGVDTVQGDVDGIADGVSALTGGHMIGPPQWLHGMAGETMAQTLNEMQLDLLDYSNP